MSTFTVHVPAGVADEATRAERTVFVREGFDWPSFLLGPLALLYRGLWRATLAWVIAAAALFGLAVALGLPALPRLALYLVLAVLTGLEAAEARRRALGRAGFIPAALFSGVTRDAGERLFFAGAAAPMVLPPAAGSGRTSGPPAVIGLFPPPAGPGAGRRPAGGRA